jgi:formylglycine-generating enzyme required for sulfatase activity
MSDTRNVFISYARKDGADEAERLYNDLQTHGIAAWRDIHNLNPYEDFSGEIEEAILAATHVAVIVTPDIRRSDSFVRREIAFALEENKPIIPLVFPGGRRPVTIITHTYIDFKDWGKGFSALLERLKNSGLQEITPQNRREIELAYLQTIGQRYNHWRDLYTDLAASARIETLKVKVKAGAAARYLDMQHDIFKSISHNMEDDRSKTVTVQSLDELREGIRKSKRVALIGDPGAGKTTTLERLVYELATEAAEHDDHPLPLFVRLGAYNGGDFDDFIEESFGGLALHDYLPQKRVFLLLDGLNEMQPERIPQVDAWLRAHPDLPVIITCRKLDYVGHKLPLQRIDVAPLDVRRIHLFIGNYLEDDDREKLFGALSGAPTGEAWAWFRREVENATFDGFWFGDKEPGHYWDPEQKQLKAVRQAIAEQGKLPGMLGVVRNPFLLFVTVQIYTRSGEPPANRGQLFDQFVSLLMEQRGKPAARTRPPWVHEYVQRKALAALAYRMQAEKTGTSVDDGWACRVIQEALPSEDAEQLLYLAASASIIEHGKTVRFVHQLLQEFFAAYEMGEDMRRGVPATKYWPSEQWWEPTGWEETALLLAGMGDESTQVIRWLTPMHPTLAYRCATESGVPRAENALHPLYDPLVLPMPKVKKGDEIDRWREKLPRVTPLARAEWGHILAEQGDTRRGIGLRSDGLPDMDWVEISAGEFIYQDGERLTLPTFSIARYPVTYVQFQAFLDAPDGSKQDEWWQGLTPKYQKQEMREQYFKYANHPRDSVSWYQAVAFCRWLSTKLGHEVCLPTEREWEKAARGTDGREYPWGNGYIPGYANIDETSSFGTVGPYYVRQTTAVGMYPQGISPYGVLDMSGNVWEWCLNEYRSPENIGLEGDAARVLRGGSWRDNILDSRCAVRNRYNPNYGGSSRGFRVVCSAPIP